MNWNQVKDDEKQNESGLNQQQVKFASKKLDTNADSAQGAAEDSKSKADKQLSTLNNTLKNMIQTSRKETMPAQMGLTGFYKEISNLIKRK